MGGRQELVKDLELVRKKSLEIGGPNLTKHGVLYSLGK